MIEMSSKEKSEEVQSREEVSPSPKDGASSSDSAKRKRRSEVANVIQHGRRDKRRKMASRSRSPSPRRAGRHVRSRRKDKEKRDYKLDEIFNWVRQSQIDRRHYSRSPSRYSSFSSVSRKRDRSRSRSYESRRKSSRRSHDISFDSRSDRHTSGVNVPATIPSHEKGGKFRKVIFYHVGYRRYVRKERLNRSRVRHCLMSLHRWWICVFKSQSLLKL